MTLSQLNEMSDADATAALADIFEHSAWVAAGATGKRPFTTVAALHRALINVVAAAPISQQLDLIRAHPDLAGKAARRGVLTDYSSSEQAGAGLDQLSDDEYEQFQRLNNAYKDKFAFPFVLAVKGHDKHSILRAYEARLDNDAATEMQTALEQIYTIARFRLDALIPEEG